MTGAPVKHQFDTATRQTTDAKTIADLLGSASAGLDIVERATARLTTAATHRAAVDYQNALAEAAKARDALANAPSLPGQAPTSPNGSCRVSLAGRLGAW